MDLIENFGKRSLTLQFSHDWCCSWNWFFWSMDKWISDL